MRVRLAVTIALLCALRQSAGGQDTSAVREVRARVTGVVFDSIAMRPLENATVQLVLMSGVSRSRSVVTAPNGSFSFDSVGAGTWLLGFFHSSFDLFESVGSLTRVDIRAPGSIHVPLATPSSKTIVSRVCKVDAAKDSTGLFIGYVRRAERTALRDTGHVRVQWSEVTVSKDGIFRNAPSLEAHTTSFGAFAICGVPLQASVTVRAWAGSDSSGLVELEMPERALLQRDLVIGAVTRTDVRAPNDSASGDSAVVAQLARGNGHIRGTVRRPNGQPIDGARLIYWGSGVEAASNANGVYSMRDLPTGTWTLEARALGFLPIRRAIDVYPDSDVVADLQMESLKTVLDTVKVTAQRIYMSPDMREFEMRKKSGWGYFMDEDAINKRDPIYVSDLFRMTPGVTVMWSGGFGYSILMRSRSLMSAYCVPAYFIDGMRVSVDGGQIDNWVSPQDIRAVEVYTRASNVPPQFNTMDGCGSIVIHTGGRRPTTASKK